MLGIWKNFEEIEENLTLAELEKLLAVKREQDYSDKKFAAALKGVNLDDNADNETPTFEDVKRRAEAKARGVSTESLEFAEIGIGLEGDD